MAASGDPYAVLGVSPDVSDADLRAAYRRLVSLHHPDHNNGSQESARRFEAVQDAYAQITKLRRSGSGTTGPTSRPGASQPRPGSAPPRPASASPRRPGPTPDVDARIAAMEREVRDAHEARERAMRAAREAAAQANPERPTDEELGYVKTDDSFSKIFADARSELSDRLADARDSPLGKRLADLLDELDGRRS